MTSKISFFKLVKEENKNLSWLTAVQLLLFGLLIPFRVLIVMASLSSSQGNGILYTQAERMAILCRHIGYEQPENTFVITAAGILCAYVAFHYLHSAVKLDFYHSLSMTRESLFAVKCYSSIRTFLIAYTASQLLAAVFAGIFGCMSGSILLELLLASIQGILFFLCSYAGALLAVMLTGKMLTTILATGVLGFYVPMLCLLVTMFKEIFFETVFSRTYLNSGIDILRYTSPWGLCLFAERSGKQGITGSIPDKKYMLLVIAVTLLLFLISSMLYRIHRTEAAGKALAFVKTENVIKLLLTIPASLIAAVVAYELYHSLIMEVVFLVFFGALACMIMEFIYRWDIRQVFQHKDAVFATVIISAAIFFAMRFDVIGYDTCLPEKNEIAAMSVKSARDNILYEGAEDMPEGFSAFACEEVLDYLETEEFGPIYRLAQEGVRIVKEDNTTEETTTIYLKYHLKNGKRIYRTYQVPLELYYDAMNEMMKAETFQERFYPILSWTEMYQSSLSADVYLSSLLFPELEEGMYVEIPNRKIEALREAYQKDLEELTFKEVWNGTDAIYFTSNTSNTNAVYPIGPKMTHTLEVLQEFL